MFTKEEIRGFVRYFIPVMLLWGIFYLCGYQIRYFGDPAVIWIILIVITGNIFYDWKNKRALLKKCVSVLPFALLVTVILGLVVFRSTDSWVFGIFMFVLLIGQENSSKQSFVVRLVTATILVTLLSIFVVSINSGRTPPQTDSIEKSMINEIAMWGGLVIVGGIMVVLTFYCYYTRKSRTQKTPQWRPLLVKSIKRAGTCFLFFLVFVISQIIFKHYHASFAISFMASVVLSLCYLGLCYKLGWFSDKSSTENESKESGHEELLGNSKNQVSSKKSQVGICNCCGKSGIPQELLFKIDSGQRLCANCLKEMDTISGR